MFDLGFCRKQITLFEIEILFNLLKPSGFVTYHQV